jgi:hypothetical protein
MAPGGHWYNGPSNYGPPPLANQPSCVNSKQQPSVTGTISGIFNWRGSTKEEKGETKHSRGRAIAGSYQKGYKQFQG